MKQQSEIFLLTAFQLNLCLNKRHSGTAFTLLVQGSVPDCCFLSVQILGGSGDGSRAWVSVTAMAQATRTLQASGE